MRSKVILFLLGIILILVGAIPLIGNFIPFIATQLNALPDGGSLAYEAFILLLGLIALINSIQDKKKKAMPKELMKLLGK
ncbi:hypothetical protein ACFLZZ_04610 [Nanoarchaeota archaeon]